MSNEIKARSPVRPVVVITGAAQGIGLLAAKALSATHRVTLLDLEAEKLPPAAAACGADAIYAACAFRYRYSGLPVRLGGSPWPKATVEPTPPGLRHIQELVGHQEALRAGARALRHPLAQSDRRERGLDDVAGPQMLPVLGWEVEEREQHVGVLF